MPTGEINSVIISLQLQKEPGVSLENLDPPVRIHFSLKNVSIQILSYLILSYLVVYNNNLSIYPSVVIFLLVIRNQ